MKLLRTYLLSFLLVGLFVLPALAVPPDGTVNNCEVKKAVCINKTTGQKTVGIIDPPSYFNCGPDFVQHDGDKVVIKIICLSREPACVGQTCGTYTGDCNPDIGPCYCWKKADGTTLCSNDFYCSTAEACGSDADCPAGEECVVETCCGGGGVCAGTVCDGTTYGGAEGDGGSSATGR